MHCSNTIALGTEPYMPAPNKFHQPQFLPTSNLLWNPKQKCFNDMCYILLQNLSFLSGDLTFFKNTECGITYIHNCSVTPILYMSGGTYCLKSTPNDRFFEKLFVAIFYLISQFFPENSWAKIAEEIIFVSCLMSGFGARTLALRLISQHTTY